MRKKLLKQILPLGIGWIFCAPYSMGALPSRYTPIISRSPFGKEVAPAVHPPSIALVSASTLSTLQKKYRLCFVMESESGEKLAGFENLHPAPGVPKSVLLGEGERIQDLCVVSINVSSECVKVGMGGTVIEMSLTAPAHPVSAKPSTRSSASPRKFGKTTLHPSSRKQPSPEELKEMRLARKKRLQAYQMEVIRSGLPALPIPLTKEMDDQLVSEGVLPPLEE